MNKILSVLALGLALASSGAFAATHAGAPMAEKDGKSAQQNKMVTCNKDAAGKKGDERKAFMKTCLSDGKTAQQNKMTTCNADAKSMKGDERKKFMSECLKKS
jgi:hypothetical protein